MGTFNLRECTRDDGLFENEKKWLNDRAILPWTMLQHVTMSDMRRRCSKLCRRARRSAYVKLEKPGRRRPRTRRHRYHLHHRRPGRCCRYHLSRHLRLCRRHH